MNIRRTGRFSAAVLAVLIATVVLAPNASATVTVGQTAPSPASLVECEGPFDELQTTVASGASYVVPAPGGVLTSWSTATGALPGQSLELKVFRPLGGVAYRVLAHDGPRPLTSGILNTFPVSIPVQAGDVIGTQVPEGIKTNCVFETLLPGDQIIFREGNIADGGTFEPELLPETEFRINLSAALLPPPQISSISPAAGSIAGANFASVQGVSFGSVPAASFTVDSEGQITAHAPKSKTLTKVPVTVTTIAGAAKSATSYAYQGCLVPRLKGSTLKVATRKARKANCKLGTVKKLGGATAKTGKVSRQSPAPGKVLIPGARINVELRS